MMKITADQTKDMLMYVARTVLESKEMLSEADRNIGDGDHGIAMANGFGAALTELETHDFGDVYAIFSTVGRTMIRVMGGASGIIFGLLLFAGAKNMPSKKELDTREFTEIFEKALAEIQLKGQAKLGDKTLVDGLAPMVAAMQRCTADGAGFKELLAKAYLAAEDGKEASKHYVARLGKAKTLGERAIGYPDAGCVSLSVITRAMRDWSQVNL